MQFQTVCVAGTFDGLHRGHERLLEAAFLHGQKVILALTSDGFVDRYKKSTSGITIGSWIDRKTTLKAWLKAKNYRDRVKIISIDDPIGPALTADFDALIVTSQNKNQGEAINRLRKKNHKPLFTLIEVDLVGAEDLKPISSSRVRQKEIDRLGRLMMPDSMRPELALPLGIVLTTKEMIVQSIHRNSDAIIIAVGDQTTKTLLEYSAYISLIIIDHRVNRKPFDELKPILHTLRAITTQVVSGPGYISQESIKAIARWRREYAENKVSQLTHIVEIDGEEDLLVLPVIDHAPFYSTVYYGQPGVGMVEVVVTEEKKNQAIAFFRKFIVQ